MKDKYLELMGGPLGKIAKTLGLPQPVALQRFGSTPESYLRRPVLVTGSGSGAQTIADLLLDNGFEVRRHAAPDESLRAIIAVLDDVTSPSELSETVLGLGGAVRSLAKCGRVVTISAAPDPTAQEPQVAAATQGITGLTRSLAHEMRRGATANGILLGRGVGIDTPSVASALWFLLSGKSAYVDGQFITVTSGAGESVTDAEFLATGQAGPLAGRTAVVTGAARGIGAEVARVLARDGAHLIGVDMPQAGQALRPSPAGDDAKRHLRQRDLRLRIGAGDPMSAGQCQLGATAHAGAVDHRHRWHRQRGNPAEPCVRGIDEATDLIRRSQRQHLADVGSRHETVGLGAGQHY